MRQCACNAVLLYSCMAAKLYACMGQYGCTDLRLYSCMAYNCTTPTLVWLCAAVWDSMAVWLTYVCTAGRLLGLQGPAGAARLQAQLPSGLGLQARGPRLKSASQFHKLAVSPRQVGPASSKLPA